MGIPRLSEGRKEGKGREMKERDGKMKGRQDEMKLMLAALCRLGLFCRFLLLFGGGGGGGGGGGRGAGRECSPIYADAVTIDADQIRRRIRRRQVPLLSVLVGCPSEL